MSLSVTRHLSTRTLTSDTSFSFLDINPLARGHSLVIPKCGLALLIVRVITLIFLLVVDHGEKLHDIPDEYLQDSLIVAKKIAVASGFENYNILQVRGVIDHLRSCCVRLMKSTSCSEQREDRSPGESHRSFDS